MARVEILDGIERRRRWSDAEKRRIVEETLAPGARMAEVARRNGACRSLVFAWRRQALEPVPARPAPLFLPVEIGEAAGAGLAGKQKPSRRPRAAGKAPSGLIEIELRGGHRIRVDARVDSGALGRVLDALARR